MALWRIGEVKTCVVSARRMDVVIKVVEHVEGGIAL